MQWDALSVPVVIYLIGPSAVGQANAAHFLDEAGVAIHLDLDTHLRDASDVRSHLEAVQDWPMIARRFSELEARIWDICRDMPYKSPAQAIYRNRA
jgi:hypothetical protein